MTSEEREKLFRKELQDLLDKHGAEIEIGDNGEPYGLHSGQVTVYMKAEYDTKGNCLMHFTDFVL